MVGDLNFKKSSEFKSLENKHDKILKSYFNQKWNDCLNEMNIAKNLCNNLMNDYYNIMSERIHEYKKNPPPQDWDGVYVATSK